MSHFISFELFIIFKTIFLSYYSNFSVLFLSFQFVSLCAVISLSGWRHTLMQLKYFFLVFLKMQAYFFHVSISAIQNAYGYKISGGISILYNKKCIEKLLLNAQANIWKIKKISLIKWVEFQLFSKGWNMKGVFISNFYIDLSTLYSILVYGLKNKNLEIIPYHFSS